MTPQNSILFFSAYANNTLKERVDSVDFEKMFEEGYAKYDNFEAHYFNTLTEMETEDNYRPFEDKIQHIGWNIHRGLDTKVTKRSYAHVVDALSMASKFYPIVEDFLEKYDTDQGEELDLIFCVFHLSYGALFDTILSDPFFYDDPENMENRWINIKLLNEPGKTNAYLLQKADEVIDVRSVDIEL